MRRTSCVPAQATSTSAVDDAPFQGARAATGALTHIRSPRGKVENPEVQPRRQAQKRKGTLSGLRLAAAALAHSAAPAADACAVSSQLGC